MKEKENESMPSDSLYSDTAYDDAFRTMEGRCDDILIPFVSYMFGEKYGKGAVVKRLRNEHFVEHKDSVDEKRITDSSFEIIYNDVTKLYHLECESSKYDGTILIRIFEYDSQIAKDNAERSLSSIRLRFPNSGLLLLRGTDKAPDKASIVMEAPDGKEMSYEVPIMKVSDYSIEDIFREKLYMLIPFYIFNYEKQLPGINDNENDLDSFMERFRIIVNKLESELDKGLLSASSYSAILKLTRTVAYKMTMNQKNVQRKVGDFVGGKILDLPEFRIYDQGKAEGREEGRAEAIKEKDAEISRIVAAKDARIKELEEQLAAKG